jgi:hypothetical protein
MSMSPDATFPDPMPPAPYTDGMPLTLSNRTKKEPALSSLRRSAALRLVWQLGGTLGLAVSAGVGLVLFIQGSDRSRDAAAVTVGRGGALAASESAPSPSPPPAVPLEPQRTDPPPRVKLHANAKLTSLRINARFLPVAPPVTDLAFERLAEDGDGGLTVVATALDGRKRAMTLAPGASSLEVDFAPLPARQTVGTPSRPAPVAAPPPKNDEIPPNPFTQAGHGANPSGSP